MSDRCSVCKHSNRAEIDQLLVAGESLRNVADRFGLHYSSLSRHKSHISQQLSKAIVQKESIELQQGLNVLSQIENLRIKTLDLLSQAESAGDLRAAIQAIKECRSCVELLGKASGQLAPEKILIKVEPILNTLVVILKQELDDRETLNRIIERLATVNHEEM